MRAATPGRAWAGWLVLKNGENKKKEKRGEGAEPWRGGAAAGGAGGGVRSGAVQCGDFSGGLQGKTRCRGCCGRAWRSCR